MLLVVPCSGLTRPCFRHIVSRYSAWRLPVPINWKQRKIWEQHGVETAYETSRPTGQAVYDCNRAPAVSARAVQLFVHFVFPIAGGSRWATCGNAGTPTRTRRLSRRLRYASAPRRHGVDQRPTAAGPGRPTGGARSPSQTFRNRRRQRRSIVVLPKESFCRKPSSADLRPCIRCRESVQGPQIEMRH
jgi:hypothetical protein